MTFNKPIIKTNSDAFITSGDESEAGMAKAEEDELRKSAKPLLTPPKESPKKHPTMAVYVAVSMQPRPEDRNIKRSFKSEVSSIQSVDSRKMKQVSAKKSRLKVATMQIPLHTDERYARNLYDTFSDGSNVTITDEDTASPRADHPEEIFKVEFATDARQLADIHHKAQRLVANEAFSNDVEQTPEQKIWLKELVSEAKPLLMNALFAAPLLEPENRSTVIRLRNEQKPIKVPPSSVLAQNLMQSLITEIFDPAKMLEMHVAVRLPLPTSPSPDEGAKNYAVGITTSVKVDKLCSTKSCADKEVCRTKTCKLAKTVFPTEICGRPVLIDERFFDSMLQHMQWNKASDIESALVDEPAPSAAEPASDASTHAPVTIDELVESTISTRSSATTKFTSSSSSSTTLTPSKSSVSSEIDDRFATARSQPMKDTVASIPTASSSGTEDSSSWPKTMKTDSKSKVKFEASRMDSSKTVTPSNKVIADQGFAGIPDRRTRSKSVPYSMAVASSPSPMRYVREKENRSLILTQSTEPTVRDWAPNRLSFVSVEPSTVQYVKSPKLNEFAKIVSPSPSVASQSISFARKQERSSFVSTDKLTKSTVREWAPNRRLFVSTESKTDQYEKSPSSIIRSSKSPQYQPGEQESPSIIPTVRSSKSLRSEPKLTEIARSKIDDHDESDLYFYRLIANMNQFPRTPGKNYKCFNCGYEHDDGLQQSRSRRRTKSTPAYRTL